MRSPSLWLRSPNTQHRGSVWQAGFQEQILCNRKLRICQERRRNCFIAPVLLIGIEDIGHGNRHRVVQVQLPQPQYLFNCPGEVNRVVRCRDKLMLLHVRADDERDAAVRIHVVGTILRIVVDDKDQSVVLVRTF